MRYVKRAGAYLIGDRITFIASDGTARVGTVTGQTSADVTVTSDGATHYVTRTNCADHVQLDN